MSWHTHGPWASKDGVLWFADASELDLIQNPSPLPNGQRILDLEWWAEYDSEGDVLAWQAKPLDGSEFTILND